MGTLLPRACPDGVPALLWLGIKHMHVQTAPCLIALSLFCFQKPRTLSETDDKYSSFHSSPCVLHTCMEGQQPAQGGGILPPVNPRLRFL